MYSHKKVSAVIVAAGKSRRMGFDKLMAAIEGKPVLLRSVQAFDQHPYIDEVVVVAGCNKVEIEGLLEKAGLAKPYQVVAGGETRAHSVRAGIRAAIDAELVAIHDGARPFVSKAVIGRAIEKAAQTGAAAPAVPVKDTIKETEDNRVVETPDRARLRAVQTPQVFCKEEYLQALAQWREEEYEQMTDDCMVLEKAGKEVYLVEGEEANYKITTPGDLPAAKQKNVFPRIGHGYDVHRLVEGRKLIIGGQEIPYEKGLLGHSDADVLLHAVTDALLGALALGDLGTYFPDTDERYKGADSLVLLKEAAKLVEKTGYGAYNVDATILCQQPKLKPFIPMMRKNIADALMISEQEVSVKATTEEKLGFTGAGEGIAAHCVLLAVPFQFIDN